MRRSYFYALSLTISFSYLSRFSVRTAEWCLPLDHLDAALGDVIDKCIHYSSKHAQYSLLPIYVRIVKSDDLYLSPANRNCPLGGTCDHFCYIEVLNCCYGLTIELKFYNPLKAPLSFIPCLTVCLSIYLSILLSICVCVCVCVCVNISLSPSQV